MGLPPLPRQARLGDIVGMDHLTSLDATFIEAEDSDRHVSLAIGALAVLEGCPTMTRSLGDSPIG
jgi:hypothetical protein